MPRKPKMHPLPYPELNLYGQGLQSCTDSCTVSLMTETKTLTDTLRNYGTVAAYVERIDFELDLALEMETPLHEVNVPANYHEMKVAANTLAVALRSLGVTDEQLDEALVEGLLR